MEESFVIQSSQSKALGAKKEEINSLFDVEVELQCDPNSDLGEGIQWVTIKGKEPKNVGDAKKHIIALCNPELKEHISFPKFPLFIFSAFKERIRHEVQREFGVVLSVTDDGFIDISGTNIGVTMAISKIHHLHRLNRDKDKEKARIEALQFDVYVNKIGDSYQGKLKELSNVLKKEILAILDIPVQPANGETFPKVLEISKPSSSAKVDPEIIVIDDSVQEESIEVISSSEDSSVEDDDDDDDRSEEGATAVKRVEYDGMGANGLSGSAAYVLPPNFVIKEWIRANYQGTNDPTDFVSKNDMLQHFRSHFDLPDHPDLANTFFDKLAVRIFPQDPNYRNVRTKKTKSKQGKRRLTCLRRRLATDPIGGPVHTSRASSISPPPRLQAVIPPVRQPASKAMSPPRQNPQFPRQQHPQQPSALMKDWNSNRIGMIKPPVTSNPTAPGQQWQTVQARQPLGNGLETWLNSGQPVPKPRTQPVHRIQRQSSEVMNSLAKRVSEMTNNELIRKPRPQPNPDLRHVIIDGSNVAMSHGNHSKFSCRGIALCARFFIERGHKDVTCFVPNYRKGGGGNPPSNDHYLLLQLEDIGVLKATPSRRINGQNIVCYDDRFIVELAAATNGVIVSNDQYRDLMAEEPRWRRVVEQQLLQFTIVGDLLMLPEDPLGRDGPALEDFLTNPRKGRTTQPQQKVVKVPAPARPKEPVQRPPVSAAKPPLLPTPVRQFPTLPPPRQLPPVPNAWMLPPGPIPQVLSPDQHILAYEMLKILPDKEKEINKVITDHPMITDITQLMNILFLSDSGP